MKRIYWRPPSVSRAVLLLIATLAVAAVAAVETMGVERQQPWYAEKLAAARLATRAMEAIRAEKQRRGLRHDPETDPAGTGMIGEPVTPVTSNTGNLLAKQRSTNPNFAAVVVHYLRRANVSKGDLVAVGLSGSFPALNVATYAAIEAIEAEPIAISSVSGSEWGANHPEYLWVDMERTLVESGVFHHRSAAASRGGIDDRGVGMSKEGRALVDAAIVRSGAERLDTKSLVESIDRRMQVYAARAGDRPIRAYVNVGGGSASVGTHVGKKQFKPGLNREPPPGARLMDSVMLRFAERDVPVIHLTSIEELGKRHGLDLRTEGVSPVGAGKVYVQEEYNRWLAGASVVLVLAAMLAFIRLDVGLRILRGASRSASGSRQPQQMV